MTKIKSVSLAPDVEMYYEVIFGVTSRETRRSGVREEDTTVRDDGKT